jgi:O-antigen ligase
MNGPVFSSAQRINASGARDALLLFGILMFSLPLKTPALQGVLEEALGVSFPLRLSTYTLLLPPWLGLIVWIHRKRIPEVWRRLKVPLLLLAALFLWMWLGAWFSEWRAHSLKHAGRYSIHLAVFLTLLLLLIKAEFKDGAAKTFLLWFSLLTLWVALNAYYWKALPELRIPTLLSQYGLQLDLFRWNPGSGITGFFENRNPHALVAVVALLLSLWALAQKYWANAAIGLFSSLWVLYVSGSRNGILGVGLVLSMVALAGIQHLYRRGDRKLSMAVPVLVLGLGVALWVAIPNVATSRMQQKWTQFRQAQSYAQLEQRELRLVLYRLAWESAWNYPVLLGHGPKTTGFVMAEQSEPRWKKLLKQSAESFNAHNALLTIWVEMGWVGLLLALAFLAEWFRLNRKASLLVLGGGVVLCLGQVFDYFIWQITFMTVQSFAFALIAADASSHEDSRILATPEVQG